LLDFNYRKSRLERELEEINQWAVREVAELQARYSLFILFILLFPLHFILFLFYYNYFCMLIKSHRGYSAEASAAFAQEQTKLRKRAAYTSWTHAFHTGVDTISPLRGALAAFGLTPDDIGK
jgi:hypothetical protein